MALFKQMRGKRADLDTQPLHDGFAYFCTDDGSFHIDYTDADGNLQRKQISAKDAETLEGKSLDEIKAYIEGNLVQSDYDENDPSSTSYIKNRPFYDYDNSKVYEADTGTAPVVVTDMGYMYTHLYKASDEVLTPEELYGGVIEGTWLEEMSGNSGILTHIISDADAFQSNNGGFYFEVTIDTSDESGWDPINYLYVVSDYAAYSVATGIPFIANGLYLSKTYQEGAYALASKFDRLKFENKGLKKLDNKFLDLSANEDFIALQNKIAASDYNENDNTSPTYIENRPFYDNNFVCSSDSIEDENLPFSIQLDFDIDLKQFSARTLTREELFRENAEYKLEGTYQYEPVVIPLSIDNVNIITDTAAQLVFMLKTYSDYRIHIVYDYSQVSFSGLYDPVPAPSNGIYVSKNYSLGKIINRIYRDAVGELKKLDNKFLNLPENTDFKTLANEVKDSYNEVKENYLKKDAVPSDVTAGPVKVGTYTTASIYHTNGTLDLGNSKGNIKNRFGTNAIRNCDLDYAIKVGLTTNTQELSNEEKLQVKNWLGINGASAEAIKQIASLDEATDQNSLYRISSTPYILMNGERNSIEGVDVKLISVETLPEVGEPFMAEIDGALYAHFYLLTTEDILYVFDPAPEEGLTGWFDLIDLLGYSTIQSPEEATEEDVIYLVLPTDSSNDGLYYYENGWQKFIKTDDLAGYLEKDTSNGALRVYGITGNGVQTKYQLMSNASNVSEGKIPRYVKNTGAYDIPAGNEQFILPTGTPMREHHATNKKYVDQAISNVEATLDELRQADQSINNEISANKQAISALSAATEDIDAIATNLNTLTGQVNNISDEIAVERARINALATLEEGSTTGDAELIDIRVGHDGTIYETAGEHIREIDATVASISETLNPTYTNLLEHIAQEDSTTEKPTAFPAHKINTVYEHGWAYRFYSTGMTGYECYVLPALEGDRFIVSDYVTNSAVAVSLGIAFVDANFGFIAKANMHTFGLGLEACPANTAYVIINKKMDGYTPKVYSVNESIINNENTVPIATKCPNPIYYNSQHYSYFAGVGNAVTYQLKNTGVETYSAGIYPLEVGKEYTLYYNDAVIPDYSLLGIICDNNMTANITVSKEDLDKYGVYHFTAGGNDKYIVLNCFDFNGNLQFGLTRPEKAKSGAKIGNAFFDGKNDITLEDMGAVDRSLTDKKWVSYGDSITFGEGILFVSGGEKLWQDYIVARYGVNHVKMAVGYSSLTYFDTSSEITMADDRRLNPLIAESPDVVTILGGANDYIFKADIGTNDDIISKNRYTFKGSYAYIIDKILTAKPDTTIIILGMYHNTLGNYAPKNGKSVAEYAKASKDIAEYFGLPFVDLNECGFNAYNFNETTGRFSTDGIHPNAEGAKRIAMVVSKWFDAFKGTIY